MMKTLAFPFVRPLADSYLTAEPWALIQPVRNTVLEDGIPGWDRHQKLVLARRIEVDIDRLAEECLVEDASFICTVQAVTGPAVFREEIWRSASMTAGRVELSIEVTPDLNSLYRQLGLITSIILERPGKSLRQFSPAVAGARLWDDVMTTDLSGNLGRLAISAVKFSEWFPTMPNALWVLQWNPDDLDESESAVLLYLNSERKELLENRENPMTVNAMKSDIFFQMISTVLRDSDLLSMMESCGEGTVGYRINQWLLLLEEDHSRAHLIDLAKHSAGRLIPLIQSRLVLS